MFSTSYECANTIPYDWIESLFPTFAHYILVRNVQLWVRVWCICGSGYELYIYHNVSSLTITGSMLNLLMYLFKTILFSTVICAYIKLLPLYDTVQRGCNKHPVISKSIFTPMHVCAGHYCMHSSGWHLQLCLCFMLYFYALFLVSYKSDFINWVWQNHVVVYRIKKTDISFKQTTLIVHIFSTLIATSVLHTMSLLHSSVTVFGNL